MVSNYDVIKLFGKDCLEVGKDCFNFLKGFVHGHLIIPTYIRRIDDPDNSPYFYGGALPAVGHLFLGMYPTIGYVILFNYDVKLASAVLATHVSTNLASGIYEILRYEKLKLEKQSPTSSRPDQNELEKKVEEPVVETKPAKTFVNPFEVDLE